MDWVERTLCGALLAVVIFTIWALAVAYNNQDDCIASGGNYVAVGQAYMPPQIVGKVIVPGYYYNTYGCIYGPNHQIRD